MPVTLFGRLQIRRIYRKAAMVGETATEPEGDKEGLADHMTVG